MGEIADYMIDRMLEDRTGHIEQEDDDEVTCNRCGKDGLYWQTIFTADGEKYELFDNETDERHVCKIDTAGMDPE